MAADVFALQGFSIDQAGAGHRVGEDSMLFGGWIDLSQAKSVLDVGTGTGVLALIAAKRSDAKVLAVDQLISQVSLAQRNVENSPFSSRIQVLKGDITVDVSARVDHIISNPPYFLCGPAAVSNRGAARHLNTNWDAWMLGFERCRTKDSKLSLVLPFERRFVLMASALRFKWFRQREAHVCAQATSTPHLLLVTFGSSPVGGVEVEQICARHEDGHYHPSFRRYTADLYQ